MDDGGRDDNNGFAIPFPPKPRNDVPSTSAAASAGPSAAAAQPPIIIEASSKYYVPGIREKSKFRVLSQQVEISNICFATKSFHVRSELVILPCEASLRQLDFHIGKSILLPNELPEGSGKKITINGIDCEYVRRRHLENVAQLAEQSKNIPSLDPRLSENLFENDYELQIAVPRDLKKKMKHKKAVRLHIDTVVQEPTRGIQFVDFTGGREEDVHMFTYHTPYMSGTREWTVCLDEPDQLALWELTFEVDPDLVPVCSGELAEKRIWNGKILYRFSQTVPTNACNMGWAIGKFKLEPHPEQPTIYTFALAGLDHFVNFTTLYLDKMVEFLEEKLSCRFPFPTLKVVFVDQGPEEIQCYSSLLIVPTTLLYHKKIIDVVQEVRQKLIHAIAQQFFGCLISPGSWWNWWIVNSIARFLTSIYVETKLGTAESRWQMKRYMDDVCDFEHQWGKIVLSPEKLIGKKMPLHVDPRHEYTASPLYVEAMLKKGFLTIRMIQKRIGMEPFMRVLHRLLTVGLDMSEKKLLPPAWKHLLITTDSFFRNIHSVTGKEIPSFLDQWVRVGGHASFAIKFDFNRKRNLVEMEIKQEDSEGNGRMQYTGPLSVVVQEVDGAFSHTIQIDGAVSHAEISCHSKGRKQKKKKVPILTGEEIEIDLTNMDAESPILWLRIDHDYLLIREITISQPMFHWEYMLKYERDVIAQMEALERIQALPSAHSRSVIVDAVSNERFFYRIRSRAAFVLTSVQNRKSEAIAVGTPVLINMFRENFGSKAVTNIPRSNNFVVTAEKLQQYFVMQSIPQAISRLRKPSGECNEDVLPFLLDLIKFNDNSTNRYSDDFYRASLFNSLAASIYPSEYLPYRVDLPENLSNEFRVMIKEFTYALNMDTVNPSYGRVVGIAALSGLYQLQKCGYLPLDSELLWTFANRNLCIQMRRCAITLIVDRISNDTNALDTRMEDLSRLLDLVETETDPSIRAMIPKLLAETPPFGTYNNTQFGSENTCNTEETANKLWSLCTNTRIDANIRSGFLDVFFSLYALGTPPVLGGPDEASGIHRSYVTVPNAAAVLSTSQWHNSGYEAARRSPPRRDFGDEMNLMH
ncbi:Protein CBR-TAF-2 [Caenorhabditis briggsae]|uniref:Transcription initiation factor TFIID subunit 2 n=1 Tax=Caenorhabditis briggsae TaxID=6238 RepID=A8X6B2_CAEBR|nr:Protein CBR-TAF-2 [Caenorhabditis briggsae]CAP28173.1 Protein CBR-TAF-2 [Caenorhabditis briggsae]